MKETPPMSYATIFDGAIDIVPPLNEQERVFLEKLNETRGRHRENGSSMIDGTGPFEQDEDMAAIAGTSPPTGHPSPWCGWRPNETGTALEWDGDEKFSHPVEWMQYLIIHFLCPQHIAGLRFLGGHVLNGEIEAIEGEFAERAVDFTTYKWKLVVTDNDVSYE